MINSITKAVAELEKRLLKASDITYDGIDRLMRKIMKEHNVTAKQLHFGFTKKHDKTPDDWIKMKRKINEDHKEIKGGERKDEEGYMARVELDTIDKALTNLRKAIKKGDQQLPAWVQSKITKAADYIDTAADYLTSDESVDEGVSFNINPEKKPIRGAAAKLTTMTRPQRAKKEEEAPEVVKKLIGTDIPPFVPTLPKTGKGGTTTGRIKEQSNNSTIVDRVLKSLNEEEDCSCQKETPKEKEKGKVKGSKPVMSVQEIADKHGVSVARIQKQLKMGVTVEGEHTTNKEEAEGIALQHLAEKPNYYSELKKVEAVKTESTIVTDLLGNPKFEFIDLVKPYTMEEMRQLEEARKRGGTLHHWFKGSKSKDGKPGWVQADGSPCANEEGETKTPKCFSSGRLKALKRKGKKGKNLIKSAVSRKRRHDKGQQQKTGGAKPTNVETFAKGKKDRNYVEAEPSLKESLGIQEASRDRPGKGSGTKDACYHKVKSRFRVWPSAYGSASLVKCRKVGAANWGKSKVEEATLPVQNGQVMQILFSWRGKTMMSQLFFPQIRIPNRTEVTDAIVKVYPEARVLNYKVASQNLGQPLIQVPNSRSKNYLLQNKTIGEEVDYIEEAGPSLSVSRGEKLSVEQGGGLTAKGRAKYNRATGSNLKAPVTGDVKKGSKAWKRRKNFCSRSRSWKGPRGLAARRRWKCS